MISLHDATTLARTKLHSKRIMLIITIIVSGLLFGLLSAASLVVNGVSRSTREYTRTALDGQYLVKSAPVLPEGLFGVALSNPPKELAAELNAMQAAYIAHQKALAKQLAIPFDEATIPAVLIPDLYGNSVGSADKRLRINFQSPIYQEYLRKLQADYTKVAKNKVSDLKATAAAYGASQYYLNDQATVGFTTLSYLVDGKEDLSNLGKEQRPKNSDLSEYGYLTHSVRNSMYSLADDSLIKRFILPANDKRKANASAIPVVISVPEAVALFGSQYGIPEEPKNAATRLTWMKDIQQKLNGVTYTACYRNEAEVAELTKIAQTNTDIAEHKADKAYVKPSLIYDLPTQTCGAATVKQDTRTAAEKAAAAKEIDISRKLGTYQEPKRQLLTFVVAGVMPVSPQDAAFKSLPGFVSAALGAQYGLGAIIPRQMYTSLTESSRHQDILLATNNSGFNTDTLAEAGLREAIVAFPSVQAARSFIEREGCPMLEFTCKRAYFLDSYGSNYLLVDDLNKTIAKVLQFTLPIAIVIASIIIWATMARVIIDSRRETAVYRAIGAKRRDIMAIYILYSLIVASRIALFSLALGGGLALLAQVVFGGSTTDYAKVTYGVFERGQVFSFIGVNYGQLASLIVIIMAMSLVAVLPPLLRNVRRSPIDDMRDE